MTRKIVSPDDIKDFSGHRIFEIFSSLRKDETDIDGAYPCDGREFSKSDFSGGNNPYDMLLLNKARTLTYAEYDAEIAENGICFAFALDTENEKFRIPKLINNTVPQYSQTTDDIGTTEVLVTGSSSSGSGNGVNGHHILEIFPTFRMEDEIAGAWRCNGAEFSKSDFSGKDNPYTKIVELKNNLGPVVTFDYWNQIYQEKGYCSFFGLDETNEKFKIPYLADVFLEATDDTEKIGQMTDAGLPNIEGSVDNNIDTYNDLWGIINPSMYHGAFYMTTDSATRTANQNTDETYTSNLSSVGIDASLSNDIYGNSDTVQPKSFKVSYMVQLATEYGEISIADIKKEVFVGFLGQIVQSLIPINDDRLRLLNGDVLSKSTTKYVDFIEYVAGLQSEYPNLFCTETEWQASITAYDECGKFVYDESVETLRLPKISRFIEGSLDASSLGDLVSAGLPNITGSFDLGDRRTHIDNTTGAFYKKTDSPSSVWGEQSTSSGNTFGVGFSASGSNSIYGNSNTVQPKSVKALLYIVVTTSKTFIEEDIDAIKSDVSNLDDAKADTELSNLTTAGKDVITTLPMPGPTAIDLSYSSGTAYTAPADGYFSVGGYHTSTSAGQVQLENRSFGYRIATTILAGTTYGLLLPIRKGNTCYIYCDLDVSYFRFQYASGATVS